MKVIRIIVGAMFWAIFLPLMGMGWLASKAVDFVGRCIVEALEWWEGPSKRSGEDFGCRW